jgi:hypothetical protein
MGVHDAERVGQELISSPAAWDYPWSPPDGSGVLSEDGFTPRPAQDLLREYADRVTVAAVGSNAAPEVLHRKLCRGVDGAVVPFLPGRLVGCAVGHSAHVSVPGYVAAAPYRDEGVRTPVYVSLLDDAQVGRLDVTEPNYVRRRLTHASACRLELEAGPTVDAFDLYDGRWGVIAPPRARPVRFGSQEALHQLLRAQWPTYAEILGTRLEPAAGIQDTIRLLAADESLRTAVRQALHRTGWAQPSGLTG